MAFQRLSVALCIGIVSVFLLAPPATAQAKFKLKQGARGDVCVTCHVTFQDKLKKAHVHTPVAKGDCVGCHSPHASNHAKLLAADPEQVCKLCHADLVPDGARSVHQVVVEGKCLACHDPHSSDNKKNLLKAGRELCFGCHTELGERVVASKFKHPPVEEDCLNCHNPHASDAGSHLLADEVPALCLNCHDTGTQAFKKRHLNYPVEKARCTSCHNPHGSNNGALLYNTVHKPVQDKMCDQCHEGADSTPPFKLKKVGYEVCQQCHYDLVNETFAKDRVHWPVVDGRGCINCHTPHASDQDSLLRAPPLLLCGRCHSDTVARQERAQTKHPPIADGECTVCHSPHSSDSLFLFNDPSVIDLCGNCHDWQGHAIHPLGKDFTDPRNPNVTVTCLSCHRAHGTEYKHFIYFEEIKDMCVQCHMQYRR